MGALLFWSAVGEVEHVQQALEVAQVNDTAEDLGTSGGDTARPSPLEYP